MPVSARWIMVLRISCQTMIVTGAQRVAPVTIRESRAVSAMPPAVEAAARASTTGATLQRRRHRAPGTHGHRRARPRETRPRNAPGRTIASELRIDIPMGAPLAEYSAAYTVASAAQAPA